MVGLVFIPILFQPVHVVWHFSIGHANEPHCCHFETSDKNSCSESIQPEEVHCLLCEFEFSINDLPEISCPKIVIPVFVFIYNEIATQQYFKQVFTDKTPRAPPVLNYNEV